MGIRLRIRAAPSKGMHHIVALTHMLGNDPDASWTSLDLVVDTWLLSVFNLCNEIKRIGLESPFKVSVHPVTIGERSEFVTCSATIDLDEVAPKKRRSLQGVIELLQVLGRLDGYAVELRLGLRPCRMEEAVNAVRGAMVTPHADPYPRSRYHADPSRTRAGSAPREGDERKRSHRASSGAVGAGHNRSEESRSADGAGKGTRPETPRQAPQPLAVEFFLSTTGLLPPFDVTTVKRAFRRGALKLHPDLRPGKIEANREFCLFMQGYKDLLVQVHKASA